MSLFYYLNRLKIKNIHGVVSLLYKKLLTPWTLLASNRTKQKQEGGLFSRPYVLARESGCLSPYYQGNPSLCND